MPSNQFEHIQEIRNEFNQASERVRDSLNNTIKHLADGLYSRNPHFIFELIQNAEDNTYNNALPSLSFRLTKIDPTDTEGSEGTLIIKNNETGFTPDDVDVICRAGESRKEKAQGYIGEKGIGFKSVFLVTDNPHIFSNGYHFRLPERDEETGFRYIVPQWTAPPEGFDLTQTHIILPLTKADFSYDEIEEMLLDIEPETFLFLSKLQEIHIKTDSGTHLSILKNDAAMPEVELLIEGEKQHRSFSRVHRFLVCTETANKPADIHHEKREEIENRDISIAFPLDGDSASVGKIFAYLPVRSDTRFPFLINADFILPSSREDIQDVPWNHWLMDCVANLVAIMLLPVLKERNLLTAEFLETLASRLNDFGTVYGVDRDSLFHPIFKKVREAFKNEEFLPANDGTFVSAKNAKLARGNPTRNLLNHQQLGNLFESTNEIKWLSGDITQNLTPELYSFLMKLDVDEVRPRLFLNRLSERFLKQQADEWFISFYKFLSTHFRELRDDLPTKPILRLQDGTQVYPSHGEGSPPNAYLPIGIDTDSSFPIVKVGLTQDKDVRKFLLNELEVPEWDIVEEVIKHILPKYNSDAQAVPVEDHKTDFNKIERADKTDSEKKKRRLREKLQETPFILAESTAAKGTIYRKPNQLYIPSNDLRLYFDGNDFCKFVNVDKYPPCARELFKELGVMDSVRVNKKETDYEGHVVIKNVMWGPHERGLDGFDPSMEVDGLEHAINDANFKKSEFIWNCIAKPNSNCIRGIVEKSRNREYTNSSTEERVSDDFGRLLTETAWLPDSTRPCELTLDDLPESFERDAQLAEQLGMKRDEVAEFAVEHGLPLEFLNNLIQNPQEYEEFKAWKAEKKGFSPDGGSTGKNTNGKKSKPVFPTKSVRNRERWEKKFKEELENLPEKEYEQRLQSVRVTAATEYTRVWLKAMYTNDDDKMICQICEAEMPFKKHDGSYYFEAVEALTNEHFAREHEAQFLALCPECAAKYKEFVKRDRSVMREVIDQLLCSNEHKVSLKLGRHNLSFRFVEEHWIGIREILESA